MSVSLKTPADFRAAKGLTFCYLCSEPFRVTNDDIDNDHVPPTSLFAEADRNYPLQLRTHKKCNGQESPRDEFIGQLVGALHGKLPKPRDQKLQLGDIRRPDGAVVTVLFDAPNLVRIIRRWVRGFHAALYREPLTSQAFICFPPVAELNQQPGGVISPVPVPDACTELVGAIKRSRAADRVDRISCNNEQLRYECTWTHDDDGRPMCIFALDLYDWKRLGVDYGARGCVGSYPYTIPAHASLAPSKDIVFQFQNQDQLDPFGN